MSNKSPAFQFYPNDWLSAPEIVLMTPAEEGAYFRLLCYAWMNDGLPDDDEQLAALSRLGEGWSKGGSTKVRPCFVLRDGRLHSPRLDQERQKQELWRQKSSQGGKASANARWGSEKKNLPEGKGGYEMVEPKCNSSSSSSSSIFSPNSDEFRLARLLFDLIRQRKPDYKEPDLQTWAKDINRMIRLDKREPAQIEKVIRWCQDDSFWQANILSTEKLRKQFDQLEIKMQAQSPSNRKLVPAPVRRDAGGFTARERILQEKSK